MHFESRIPSRVYFAFKNFTGVFEVKHSEETLALVWPSNDWNGMLYAGNTWQH